VIVAGVVGVVLLVLAVVPVPHSFNEQLTSAFLSPGTASLSVPVGSPVNGVWATASGGSVTFAITDANGQVVYSSTGAAGSFSFQAVAPPYVVSTGSFASETVHVAGSYSAPLI
jgi:hypothetical protein